MRPLVDFSINTSNPVLHMYMHSSSLVNHSTGLMKEEQANELIRTNIIEVIEYAKERANLRFCTISEAVSLVNNRRISSF